MAHPLKSALIDIVGSEYVADSYSAVWSYAKDFSGFPAAIPGIIVRPGTTQEVSQIATLANREGVPIATRGSGMSYGGTACSYSPGERGASICLELTRMRSVVDINEVNRGVAYAPEMLDEAHKTFTALAAHGSRPLSLLGLIGPGPESVARRIGWALVYKVHGFGQEEVDRKLEIASDIVGRNDPAAIWDSDLVRNFLERALRHPHDVSHRMMGMWSYPEPCCSRDNSLGTVKAILEMMNQELDGWGGRIRPGGTAVWMHGDQDYVSFPLYHKESDPEASRKVISVWKDIV
ncbi:MAG: FAD-binding oxidoreductase [Chloroflexi bacterium]|jgi:hypothetical protein|nr:FAD-binding oxidoreductase [Chloroflexota bacterium]